MDDGVESTPGGALQLWESLLQKQTSLFRDTVAENEILRNRVNELEREVSVWKHGLTAADQEKADLLKTVSRLERNISSIKNDNALILCVIDGDGTIFAQDFIASGQAGGHKAAILLTQGLLKHMGTLDSELSVRGQVWVTIYLNKSGLMETLMYNGFCTAEQFDAFVIGFNQASPLFNIVDVGHGKEAADAKVKECLRIFTRFPQTSRVFFGGAHDNGYTSTLNHLQSEGFLEKIVLLRGYKDLAVELKSFTIPHLEIPGLFTATRLLSISYAQWRSLSLQEHNEIGRVSHKKTRGTSSSHSTPSNKGKVPLPPKQESQFDPSKPLGKQICPPCHLHYLAGLCPAGDDCKYAHHYNLSAEQLRELRRGAKQLPCPIANAGKLCPSGDPCIYGHVCPRRQSCSNKGTCKFKRPDMHV